MVIVENVELHPVITTVISIHNRKTNRIIIRVIFIPHLRKPFSKNL